MKNLETSVKVVLTVLALVAMVSGVFAFVPGFAAWFNVAGFGDVVAPVVFFTTFAIAVGMLSGDTEEE